jgi:hypothetical protein
MKNLFIIGSPRSGTTFLASLLKPTAYGSPFETQFILKIHAKLSQYGDITKLENLNSLLTDITKERAIAQWGVKFTSEDVRNALGDHFSYTDVVNYICTELMKTKGKENWGDKTPHYILKLEQLTRLYPDAKYLYIIRDGRDVALSLLKKPWGPNNIFKCAQEWDQANNKAQQNIIRELQNNGQLLAVKYEKLLGKTESECKRIYEFLGDDIENHREMLEQLIGKTMTGNHAKWKKNMTPKQISVFESVAKESLEENGYELIKPYKKLNKIQAVIYLSHHNFLQAKNLFVMNVIDGIKIKFFGKQPFNE